MRTCTHADCRNPIWKAHRSMVHCFRHSEPGRETIYRVWQAITDTPHASLRELGYQLHLAPSTVNRALWALDRRGAIVKGQTKAARAIRIIEPFSWFEGD